MSKKTVLVTGGSKGIGHATAELLLERGFRVIVLARDAGRLKQIRDDFIDAGHNELDIEVHALDMADVEQIESVVFKCKLLQDGLFGLVSNAAVEILKPGMKFSLDELEQTWKVNILGPIRMMQVCYPFLKKQKGSIVHIGSVSDFHCDANYSVYGGSKAFMKGFVGHAAQEMGPDGVRINIVSPGATDTPLMQHFIDKGQWSQEEISQFKKTIPMEQRFATSREIAEAVSFALTGPRFFHGEDIRIYGGHK